MLLIYVVNVGFNILSCFVLVNVVGVVVGMVVICEYVIGQKGIVFIKLIVVIIMFGVIILCVDVVRVKFDQYGYEILVFYVIGIGG